MPNFDLANAYLDEITDVLLGYIKSGGFDNKSVMWLIKAWTKIGIITSGNETGFHKTTAAYYMMKRTPPPSTSKRSRTLLNNLEYYEQWLPNNPTTGGDFFKRANDAMLNFVWEYRQNISGVQEKQFVLELQKWASLTGEAANKQIVFKMDQGA
jgi:hypothetical protein